MKLNAKDLRIGNYLMYNFKNKGFEVIEVCFNDFKYGFEKNIEDYRPIPLTEELLIRLGGYIYKGWDDMEFYRFEDYYFSIFELEIVQGGFVYGENKIEYLHDLQNCYYHHENQKKELTLKD